MPARLKLCHILVYKPKAPCLGNINAFFGMEIEFFLNVGNVFLGRDVLRMCHKKDCLFMYYINI